MELFISYARRDQKFARDAQENLKDIELWIDRSNLLPGQEWSDEIETSILTSDALIVAVSTASCASPYVTFEWAFAMGRGIPIIPVMIESTPIEKIHPRLCRLHVHNFENEDWAKLSALVEKTLNKPSAGHLDGRRAAERIVAYIDRKESINMVGFPGIRTHIDLDYSDAFLRRVLREHTDLVAPATLKNGIAGVQKA